MGNDPILRIKPLGFPWETSNPFLFCVHHDDAYPAGNDRMGPVASLAGRRLGDDFTVKDGFRMYHGSTVPGFPGHPHRGFETVTVMRRGVIDHADSLGAAARYGAGDVQWLTTGKGIVHSEMFPLLDREGPNPLEFFQIWLNLPSHSKLVAPHFAMFWSHQIPERIVHDEAGRQTEVKVIAGRFDNQEPLAPPPNSWAARREADVSIWTIKLAASANFALPKASPGTTRTLYYFRGGSLRIDEREIPPYHGVEVRAEAELLLRNGSEPSELLLLQGRPIQEPVVQHGPFVMNTRAEIQQALLDYQHTRFGGWPWPSDEPVHPHDESRFARHADGHIERPPV